MPLGEGAVGWPQFLGLLARSKFAGPITLQIDLPAGQAGRHPPRPGVSAKAHRGGVWRGGGSGGGGSLGCSAPGSRPAAPRRPRSRLAGRAHDPPGHGHRRHTRRLRHSELLSRLSDPFWFQALGCVMGMDWHSSGITTSVLGALKRGLNPRAGELGLYVCGGRGRHSRNTPDELRGVAERTGLDGERWCAQPAHRKDRQ